MTSSVIDSYTIQFHRREDCTGGDVLVSFEIKAEEDFLDRFDKDLIRYKVDYIISLIGKKGNEK